MKKNLLLLFAALFPLVANAQTKVEIDGIWYNITSETDKTVEVTYKGIYSYSYDDEYSGSITIPATVTYNGVEYSVTSIGNYAFEDCSSLTAISIPESVTSIGDDAFEYCRSLTAITIPEGVTCIGESAFYECSRLATITIPEGVTSIGGGAFYGCSSLTAITIPESVTSIGDCAFYNCRSLTAITIPEGVTSIGEHAFEGCYSLTAVHVSSLEVWCNIDFGDSYANPLHYTKNLYIDGELVTELAIPNSVTAIKAYAFSNCSSLTAINIPENSQLTSIGSYAFSDCSSLTSITIPEGVTSIESYAFHNCSSLTTITIPENSQLTSIGYSAFSGCSSLTAITIPEDSKLTSIGDDAFEDCSSLTAITIPEGVTSIGDDAFYNCSSLKKVINYSALDVQQYSGSNGYVAYYADRVINLDEFIGDYAFKTTDGVHYLTGYMGDDMELTLPDDYKGENYHIGRRAFENCTSLTAITIPEGVTSIGNHAFYYCSSLTTITIPEGVTSIGNYAFEDCSGLKELTLGKGLKKIASGAFAGCTALENVTIYATRPPSIEGIGNAFFSDATYENATLYVPQGCIDKYQVMLGWSGFYTIEEMEGGTPNYLTLRQADNGEVGIVVDLGRTYKLRITAFEGWKIHSVTFNDEDVTAQLTEEGTFTTPPLSDDAVLNIAYEKSASAISNARVSRIKIQGYQGTLRITGTTKGDDISVYTTDGMLVTQESAEESETELILPTGQVYIVTVADKVVKIGM